MTALGRFVFGLFVVAFLVVAWAIIAGLGAWFGTAEWLVR